MSRLNVIALLGLLSCVGCDLNMIGKPAIKGSGKVITDVRDIGDFQRVKFEGGGRVEFVVGDTPKCEVEIDDNLAEYVKTTVKDGTLSIEFTENFKSANTIKFHLASQSLTEFTVFGACDLNAKGLSGDSLKLKFSGAGSGKLVGSTNNLDVEISGSANVNAQELASKNVDVRISGAGAVSVNAQETLNVKISGTGKVSYSGNADVNQSISGVGSVKKMAAAPSE